MPILRVPTPLRSYTSGESEVSVQGTTVAEALENLVERYPELRQHLFNGDGVLRPYVNLFLGEENVKDLQGTETPLGAEDRLLLIPSIAGGREAGSPDAPAASRLCTARIRKKHVT